MDKYTKGNVLTLVSQIIKENPYYIKDKHLLNNALIKSLEDQILGMLVENSLHLYTYIVNNFKGEIDIHTFNENIDDKLIEEIKKELSFFYDFLNLRYKFYCNYINEFIDNLIELQHITNFNSIGYIKLNKGDSHHKGKFAIEISLDKEKYIYKPRNSNVEKELSNLLNKYKKNYGYKIYNFHNHSFCKFIEYKPPKDIQDIQEYFYNQGFISAILYFLSSSDNHYENIIINNTYPYYIDLECFSLHKYNSNYALRRLNNSIFQTNIFPFTMDDRYVNLSALTGSAHDIINPTYNYKGYVLKNNKYVEQEIIPCTSEAKNNVLVNGEIIEPINHLQSIKKGFSEVCDLILKNKIKYNDLHAIFSRPNTIKRYIYRDTDIYYRVLKLMEEPYYLQSKEHAKLAISSIHSNSELPLIKEYEEKTLLEGDIPIYYIHGTSLVTGDGDKIENFFSLSLYDQIKEKVKNFTLEDKRNCLENIEKSLIIDYYNLNKKGVYLNGQNSNKHDYFLNCISNLNNDYKFYISFTNDVAKVTYINSFMYEMGGTILASNLFSKINGININARAIKHNTNENKYINSIDSTYGISSYIYYIYMLYKINNDDKLLEDFNEMLNILLSYDYEKVPKDLFGGLSGSLLILNKIYQDLDSKSNYKKLLLKVITKQSKVFNNIDFSKLSAGYAHGLSGIIYTLNSIYKNFETKETSNKILNLISLEDSYFNNKIGNYLDARSNVYDHYYLCYGLPGILQVRLRLESTFKNKEFIKKSLLKLGNLILNDKLEFNSLSLCHGIGSILDLFIDAKNHEIIDCNFIDKVIAKMVKYANSVKVPIFEKHEGFGTGLSGYHYTLLRMEHPYLPSLLLFDII